MKKITLLTFIASIQFVSAQTVGIELFAQGLTQPTEIAHAGDSRLFVVEKGGSIKVVNSDGSVNPTPFLAIPSSQLSFGFERGLLGLAFHPQYATNGHFFICYTRSGDGAIMISRYSVSSDPNVANANSETPILTIPHPVTDIHNGGTLRFGPDGYLYIGIGDGGWPPQNAGDITSNLGKLLRIDVDNPGNGLPYSCPDTNPYRFTLGNDEIWGRGFRNPWKFSFDSLTGGLWITDVGQSFLEEINHVTIDQPGLHFGWNCLEGTSVFSEADCPSDLSILTMPVAEYAHGEGACSITGGYVYRGSLYPAFQGKFFFTDFCQPWIGMVDAITYEVTISPQLANGPYSFTTFGQDVNGELYLGSLGQGKIYRIVDNDLSVNNQSTISFEVAPNPASRQAQIRLAENSIPAVARIYDMSGKLLLKKRLVRETSQVDISALQKGIYVISIADENGNSTQVKLAKI